MRILLKHVTFDICKTGMKSSIILNKIFIYLVCGPCGDKKIILKILKNKLFKPILFENSNSIEQKKKKKKKKSY
jgi:hypothetical protein